MPRNTRTLEEYVWARVRKSDGCWFWGGYITGFGYGLVEYTPADAPRIRKAAHRVVYELVVGPIPEGLDLDHLCRVRHCVNPAHLEPVTNKENILRGTAPSALNAKKTHCLRGHELSGANVYVDPKRRGRQCRECKNAEKRRRRALLPKKVKTHFRCGHEKAGNTYTGGHWPCCHKCRIQRGRDARRRAREAKAA